VVPGREDMATQLTPALPNDQGMVAQSGPAFPYVNNLKSIFVRRSQLCDLIRQLIILMSQHLDEHLVKPHSAY